VKAGETFEVTFKSAAEQFKGFQFTHVAQRPETVDVVERDNVTANNFNLLFRKRMSRFLSTEHRSSRFVSSAEKSGKLSEMLGVSGAITRAEAYPVTDNQSPITSQPSWE
jgi:hypothetical protein